MGIVKNILEGALPAGKVVERKGEVDLQLPTGAHVRFRILSRPEEIDDARGPSLLLLDRADLRTLRALRETNSSFVTPDGVVFLATPTVYVDIRPTRSRSDPDRTRNPFSVTGRQVCVSLLLFPERDWSIRELATMSSASESFVSRVVGALEDQGYLDVEGKVFRPRAEFLFAALAAEWPKPRAFFAGRAPSARGEAVIGGGPAYEHLQLVVPARPRAYVASRDQLRLLTVQTNSTPATSQTADWEAVIQPIPLPNGLAPELICALELAGDPRGREVLRSRKLVPWPMHV